MASSPNESERNHSTRRTKQAFKVDFHDSQNPFTSHPVFVPLSKLPAFVLSFCLLFADLELRNSSASTASPSVTSAAGSAGSGTSASGPEDFDAFYRHRGRSPARKTLEALTKVWYTWLPPKAIDSFQKGTFVIHDLMRAKEMNHVLLRKEKKGGWKKVFHGLQNFLCCFFLYDGRKKSQQN